ncbi:hypothetical protein WN51_06321 [Melipona quadrifasciata]|uniref:Ig-like domain-containing protein n=1 Tax=Melipona quadrifasciata TaxID=166423 RepID=A0A0N0BCL2_9HYME|nr:hypothetical protein WN51_06321 [Melipona quadrifasciata]
MPGKNERREKSVAEIGHESTEPDESENQAARNGAGEGKTPTKGVENNEKHHGIKNKIFRALTPAIYLENILSLRSLLLVGLSEQNKIPKTEILGAPDLYINRGSTINLTCVVLLSPEPPAYIFWNHNDAEQLNEIQYRVLFNRGRLPKRQGEDVAKSVSTIITYDPTRGGVSVVTEKGDITRSFLLVQEAKPSDSGRYTCNPSNAQSKSITVHVLNGE